jgi:hypothetical protein
MSFLSMNIYPKKREKQLYEGIVIGGGLSNLLIQQTNMVTSPLLSVDQPGNDEMFRFHELPEFFIAAGSRDASSQN